MGNSSIWILGKTGQLAQCFADSFKNETSAATRFLGRDEIDFEHDLFEQLSELNEIPDVIINNLVFSRLQEPDVLEKGYVLEGYPRNRQQVISMQQRGIIPDHASKILKYLF